MTWKAAAQVEPLNMPTGVKFVLLKYANHADNDGFDTCPSYERVAHFTGHNKKTIERLVTRLRDEGILVSQGAPYGGRGKRGRGIAYRIDFERAREVYGYWEERRTNSGFEFKLVPALVVVENGLDDDAEPGDVVVGETGDVMSSVSETETGDIASQTNDISDLNRRHDSAAKPQETAVSSDESTKNLPESARAREAGGDDPEGPPPACAVWRDNRAKLEALDCWPLLERGIPTEDDGEVLTLAVEAPAPSTVGASIDKRVLLRARKDHGPTVRSLHLVAGGVVDATRNTWQLAQHLAEGGHKQSIVWFIDHLKSETGHGTQKPVECMRRPIVNNSTPDSEVFDPFLGSGITIIAAEMEGRRCLGRRSIRLLSTSSAI